MKTIAAALLLVIGLAASAAAHDRGYDMLKQAAVNHDLVKMKRQFKLLVRQNEPVPRAVLER